MIKDELDLARKLKKSMAFDFREVFDNINLASKKFYPYWKKWHGEPVFSAQPQIDLMFVTTNLQLLAVELKYFRKTKEGKIKNPFYAGIGEALALLRFGFSAVSLWHFFDEKLDREYYERLYGNCFSLINYLDLPINYQGYRVFQDNEQLEFGVLYLGGEAEIRDLPSPYGGGDNPCESKPNARRVQNMLRSFYRIPHPE